MKTSPRPSVRRDRGYALMTVMIFGAISFLLLSGIMDWSTQSAKNSARSRQLLETRFVAEAATEKVLSKLTSDYKNSDGEATVYANLSTYRTMLPTSSENPKFADYQFNDAQGNVGQTYVSRILDQQFVPLQSQYSGLYGYASTYRVISNVMRNNSSYAIVGAVQQDVQLASIPIFQFAIFYNSLLEFTWAATLTVRGRVHANGNIYTGSAAALSISNDVTATGMIVKTQWWGYTLSQMSGAITYSGQVDTNVSSLSLPIGTNNTPAAVREVINQPPAGEAVTSAMGKERFYNKADMLILVSNSTVTVAIKSPLATTSNNILFTNASYFINTNATFTDQREGSKLVRATEIDVGKMVTWMGTNSVVSNAIASGTIAGPPNVLYIANNRTNTSTQLPAIRLINGTRLPSRGLTIATPNPLYVKGNYNCTNAAYLGTTNTSATRPASFICDALTILSSNWTDSASSNTFNSGGGTRVAANNTVNAAILAGIVNSGGTQGTNPISGGVVNLPRLLEDWSSKTLTINGSIVNLYNSAKATNRFLMPGAYYLAPTRQFSFDPNFYDPAKLPPSTPQLRALVRGQWISPPPNVINYVQTSY